ncbi:MAG: carbohydrate-binding domain-containing protein [Lachnospiraceae bacterium]|nr:carbohydrate-binding domain-containing protein [Lachnospiraceae bacterium]
MNKKKNRTVQNTENIKKQKEKLRKEQVMTAAFLLYGIFFATGCTFNPGSVSTTSGVTSETSISTDAVEVEAEDDGSVTITEEGSYVLSGKITGTVTVDASKDAKVEIILNGADIESEAPIFIKQADKVTITLADGTTNTITQTGDFITIDDEELNAAIYSKEDLVFDGNGSLTITSKEGHAVKSKDDLKVKAGNITIEAAKDGMHVKEELTVDGGTLKITAAEGLEATVVTINDGDITIEASDDGINASLKSDDITTAKVEINGGNLTITMGSGDTDGIDANGDLYINGGTITINAQFPFDYDGTAELNGGTVIVNGEEVTELTNQFGGGTGGGRGNMPQDFDPDNMPQGPGKGDMPEDFDPDNMPEGFDKGQRPQR